jgi:hypothetical protein
MTTIICPECGAIAETNGEGYITAHPARILYGDPPYRDEVAVCPGAGTFYFEGQSTGSVHAIPTPPPGSGKKRK